MKVLAYEKANEINQFAIEKREVPEPTLRSTDILVEVKAVSVNPVDYKLRKTKNAEAGKAIVLGFDAAGIVKKVGAAARGFAVGDEVYYAGELRREGSNAEFQAVDYRLVARKPKSLDFAAAAALPLTALTAWEALFEHGGLLKASQAKVLIIGGAGGVGSMATQLLKYKTSAQVIVTASRPETSDWAKKMGADVILNHHQPLIDELKKNGIGQLDLVFSTTHSENYIKGLPEIIRPFGRLVLIDDPETFDISGFKFKSISVAWELMFTKSLFNYHMESQGEILAEVSSGVDQGKIKTTANVILNGFSAETLKKAHELSESSQSIGKIVIQY